jgi:uncharacterized protein
MNLQQIEEKGLLLFKAIAGSQAYGTNTPTSDTDIRYVFILPEDNILGTKYRDQVSEDANDITGYEIKRFLELLEKNNPHVVEFLNFPEDCILYKHPLFDLILEQKDKFITKRLRDTLAGYARQQITKAKGQDKKMNWDKARVTRKTPLDFCYVPYEKGSIPLKKWLEKGNMVQERCGLTNIDHMRDMYHLYYDFSGTLNYKGVIQSEELSNDISLTSIPKFEWYSTIVYYNQDGYSMHCKDYREYEEWLEKRNMSRWTDTVTHGQMIDGKNMMHCVRLIRMAKEIAKGEGIIVRRPDAEYLKSIRRGEVDLIELLDEAAQEVKEIDYLFRASNLPEETDKELIHNLLVRIRREFYWERIKKQLK